MADLAQLERALVNADAVGDTAAAQTLAGEIRRMRGASGAPGQPQAAPVKIGKEGLPDALRETLRGTDWGTRNIAGAGTALRNVWEGGKQLFGLGDPDAIEQQRIIAQEAPVGAIAGSVATYAPLAMIPGANTVAGGAAMGAATGALQPTTEGESRLANAAIGGAVGGAVPAAIRTAKTAKAALVDPFTEAGRQRIAGGVINRTAADPQAAVAKMFAARGATPGFSPTAAQGADDAGIAALERATRAANPGAFDDVEKSQRAALADAIRGIAGDDVRRQAAITARESAVNPLYDAAKQATVQGDETFNALLQRPSMQAAAGRAANLSAERGDRAGIISGHHGYSLRKGMPEQISETGLLDSSGAPITRIIPETQATYPGQALHDLKMGLDDAIGTPGIGGMQGAERAAATGTKADYLQWLESKIPEYGQARQTYADMSRPINQMDIGQEFAKRLIPGLYRDMPAPAQLNAQAFARALTDQGDDIARSATGMKGARLESVMEPQQMQALRGVSSDLQMMKAAENAGRGVGSDTVQKTAMSHIAAQAGIPNWMADVARVPGGMLKQAGNLLYGRSDDQVRQIMAEMLKNPKEAARAMQAAGVNPSVMAELLARGTQGAALSATPMLLNQ